MKSKASEEAESRLDTAKAQARRIVEEGVKRRRDIESVISDLVRRRDAVLEEATGLSGALADAVSEHKPSGADPFATPDELDPGEAEEIEGELTDDVEPEALEDEAAEEGIAKPEPEEGATDEGGDAEEPQAKKTRRGKGDGRSRKRGARVRA